MSAENIFLEMYQVDPSNETNLRKILVNMADESGIDIDFNVNPELSDKHKEHRISAVAACITDSIPLNRSETTALAKLSTARVHEIKTAAFMVRPNVFAKKKNVVIPETDKKIELARLTANTILPAANELFEWLFKLAEPQA